MKSLLLAALAAAVFWITGLGVAAAMAQMQVPPGLEGQLIQEVCADNGALIAKLVALVAGLGWTGAILANLKTLQRMPVIGTILNIVGANWSTWLREAATAAAKAPDPRPAARDVVKALPFLVLLGLGATLVACAGGTGGVVGAVGTIESCQADASSAQCKADQADVALGEVCTAYGNLLLAIAGGKTRPAVAVLDTVDETIGMMQPLCHGAAPADATSALALAQATLAKLQAARAANP